MQCPRCLNTDKAYFYKGSRGWYCRRCISFGRIMLEEDNEPVSLSPVSEGSEEYVCAECGRPYQNRVLFQVDHIKPMSRGGRTVSENLQILCRDCNRKKGDKWE